MLTIEDDARDYLFVLLDHVHRHVPPGSCFRLCRDASGQPVLRLSTETAEDELSEHDGRTILVWDPRELPPSTESVLELETDEFEDDVLVLAQKEPRGTLVETVVELDARLQGILARTS